MGTGNATAPKTKGGHVRMDEQSLSHTKMMQHDGIDENRLCHRGMPAQKLRQAFILLIYRLNSLMLLLDASSFP